jgi:hypothetical protein
MAMILFYFSTFKQNLVKFIDSNIAMFSLGKAFFPCGIRTRVVCSCGEWDVHCATPPPGHVLRKFWMLRLSQRQSGWR